VHIIVIFICELPFRRVMVYATNKMIKIQYRVAFGVWHDFFPPLTFHIPTYNILPDGNGYFSGFVFGVMPYNRRTVFKLIVVVVNNRSPVCSSSAIIIMVSLWSPNLPLIPLIFFHCSEYTNLKFNDIIPIV